jgi:hypothetical protein
MITNHDLLIHLEDIINDLKNDTISEEKKRELTLFYIKNKYKEKNEENDDNLKYLSLGWYIYNFLLSNKNE